MNTQTPNDVNQNHVCCEQITYKHKKKKQKRRRPPKKNVIINTILSVYYLRAAYVVHHVYGVPYV